MRLLSENETVTNDKQNMKERFEHLVQEHKDTIYMVCYMFSKDKDEVADLFQETLINLWRGLAHMETANVRGWVYRVCLNTCISQERKKKAHPTIPLSMDINPFDSESGKNRQTALLHKRIIKLQPFDRAIILLWLENISYEEIGLILGISTKNVSVRLIRIKEQLKQMSNE